MDYKDDLIINDDDLLTELKQQHIKFSHWGSEYSKAQKRTKEAKVLHEEEVAKLRSKIRKELDETVKGRITDSMILDRLYLEPGYRKSKLSVLRAEFQEDEAKNARDAMWMRKDLLLELNRSIGRESANTYERLAKQLDGRRSPVAKRNRSEDEQEQPTEDYL